MTKQSPSSERCDPTSCCSTCTFPSGGGDTVIRALRDDQIDTRFLALSVSDAAEDVIAVVRAGARGYVTKTITIEELRQAIERVHAG